MKHSDKNGKEESPKNFLNSIFFDDTNNKTNKPSRYRIMWRNTVLVVAAVSIIPLITITAANYYLYQQSFKREITEPINRITSITKHFLESFLEERIAAAKYIVSRERSEDLFDSDKLPDILTRMRKSFGGIVDIGVVDSSGIMRAYEGPYDLRGKVCHNQDWFTKMLTRDVYVSDVFLGNRKVPHFVIAVKREDQQGKSIIFRVTIDTEQMERQIQVAGGKQISDAFLINTKGILQTPSRLFGSILENFPGGIPAYSQGSELLENVWLQNQFYLMGTAHIEKSSFIFVILANQKDLMKSWFTYQSEMLLFLIFSTVAILLIIMRITTRWVTHIKEADLRREATLHNIEHTNRMASIGRLAAGVAHEINNPLAIINEKAGLITDILTFTKDHPQDNKIIKQTQSIIESVSRCSEITHRLLGFARHMDVKSEPLALDSLIGDVLGFLEKEAAYRDIKTQIKTSDTLPTIHSDKGQLQQLFLNLINNAFDAMKKGGHLNINIKKYPPKCVTVIIKDDGSGIPRKALEKIFEPFFSTKRDKGTGLGLSITYGIVQKLGGTISVDSQVGIGTTFYVTLPENRQQ